MTDAAAPRVSPRDMISSKLCTGCGACAAADAEASLTWNAEGHLGPAGPDRWMTHRSEAFSQTCPFSPRARDEDAIAAERFPLAAHRDPWIGRYQAAYVGHAAEPGFRENGSSGGMVSWVASELLRRGLVDGVAHVVPQQRSHPAAALFAYRISRTPEELEGGAKSRYYPVEMSGVLREIRNTPGRYAVVGVPCFVKAVHLLRGEDPILRERIAYTLGLVCGHMKSRFMVESFAWQMGIEPDAVAAVEFRLKDPERPANWYTARLTAADGTSRLQDWWHLVDGDWGSGFFQNPACDYCDDVVAETADICFGDAWLEPYSSDGRGTNVVVARSAELDAILADGMAQGRLALDRVDADFVRETQAAGFRQRREGLAYRLTWRRHGLRPRKRVRPNPAGLSLRRRLIYRCRHHIAIWSARVFGHARRLRRPGLFVAWARGILYIYHALAYSRGWLGRAMDAAARAAPSRPSTSRPRRS